IGLEVILRREGCTRAGRHANGWRNVVEGISGNICHNAFMRTDAVTDFAADPQPVGRINVDKRARLTAKLRVLQAMNIVVSLEEKLASKSHAEPIIVNQSKGYVVISGREACSLSLPTQRDQRLSGEAIFIGTFKFGCNKTSSTNLQIPVT